MIDLHHLPDNPSSEDRQIRAKWARGVAITVQHLIAELSSEAPVATAHAKAASPSGRD